MLITLLTDFGTDDAYLAQMKGQILTVCPGARIIDVTHAIPAQDIEYGALMLAQSAPYFPADTVHVAVVDPGVGTSRQMIALESLTQADEGSVPCRQRFVLPDNGLISLIIDRFGMLGANYLTNQQFWRSGVSRTFHGRDIMGPVAGHWTSGMRRSNFGPACPTPVRLSLAEPKYAQNSATGEVISVDHYGNVITNLSEEEFAKRFAVGKILTLHLLEREPISVTVVSTYGQQASGDLVALVGSQGYVELARVGGSAAALLEIGRRATVKLTA